MSILFISSDDHIPGTVAENAVKRMRKDMFMPVLKACDDARQQLAAADIQIQVRQVFCLF